MLRKLQYIIPIGEKYIGGVIKYKKYFQVTFWKN